MTDHTHDELEDRVRQLEALEERIQRLEKALQPTSAEEYVDSGSIHPELDDQGIAP
jgi:hypothetical protein